MYSKYAGTEVEFNDSKHLILKEDDIIGILESDDAKDMKPLNDRVLIKVCSLLAISILSEMFSFWIINLEICELLLYPALVRKQVAEAEDKTPGGLILTETTKEKPSIGTVSS